MQSWKARSILITPKAALAWAAALVAAMSLSGCASATVATVTPPAPVKVGPAGPVASAPASGYWLATSTGEVRAFGAAPLGTVAPVKGNGSPVVGMAPSAGGRGYWLATAGGEVSAVGGARAYGPKAALSGSRPIVGIVATPDGDGYWLVTSNGRIYPFGDATLPGSDGSTALDLHVVGMAITRGGGGYWLVARSGLTVAFGDAYSYGSASAIKLGSPVVGIAAAPNNKGYWLTTAKGQVVAFGDAANLGSVAPAQLKGKVVGITATPDGHGYWLATKNGAVFAFGDALFLGSDLGTVPTGQSVSVIVESRTSVATSGRGAAPGETMATSVCGQPVLESPYEYDRYRGSDTQTYKSGTPGLPTFGSSDAAFPDATTGVLVPAGNNSSILQGGSLSAPNTVYYFEPGMHTSDGNGIGPGDNSAYVGGYNSAAGEATIDGDALAGAQNPFIGLGGTVTGVTLEYLTVKNWVSNKNSSVIDTPGNNDWTIEYNTIGPNEYGPKATGQNSDGGYAIDMGSGTTVEYNCLTQDAQGGFNMPNGAGAPLNTGDVISYNEISWDGLGEYPDDGGTDANPNSCGCSGGGKFSWSTNFVFTHNYVHNNYNAGVWGDFNNAGADISYNYIASNWGWGIMYEASYNADISDNVLVGNGWASDGTWPTTSYNCSSYTTCTDGIGPATGKGGGNPYGAIQLNNSGGNNSIKSEYSGELLVEDNTLHNNFGGVIVYTDSGRASGTEPNRDGQCDSPLQSLSSTYYQNEDQDDDTDVSTTRGSDLVTAGDTGFTRFFSSSCQNPGPVTTPSAGMFVYAPNADIPANDTVSSCSSATSCTLTKAAIATATGVWVDLSTPGGCSLYDLSTAKGPVQGPGTLSGSPPADYWDNCIWGSKNITVSGNVFAMHSAVVAGCTTATLCGAMGAFAFNPGISPWWLIWDPYYTNHIAIASSPLHVAWSDNSYSWKGPGSWQFYAGFQGSKASHSTWARDDDQDAGSTGL